MIQLTAEENLALQRIIKEKLKDLELTIQYDAQTNHNRPFYLKQREELTQALAKLTEQVPF